MLIDFFFEEGNKNMFGRTVDANWIGKLWASEALLTCFRNFSSSQNGTVLLALQMKTSEGVFK